MKKKLLLRTEELKLYQDAKVCYISKKKKKKKKKNPKKSKKIPVGFHNGSNYD